MKSSMKRPFVHFKLIYSGIELKCPHTQSALTAKASRPASHSINHGPQTGCHMRTERAGHTGVRGAWPGSQ